MTVEHLVHSTRQLGQMLRAMAEVCVRSRDTIDRALQEALRNFPEIYGVWTVWEPNALDKKDLYFRNRPGHDHTGRYIPFWYRSGNQVFVEPNTNYDIEGLGDYYLIPKKTRTERTVRFSEYIHLNGMRRFFTCHIVPLMVSDRFLGVAGIDVLPGKIEISHPPTTQYPLTPRELEVLKWLAEGKSNAEIAIILGNSIHTIKRHVESILAKLGVEHRRAAMLAYHRSSHL